MSSIYGLNRTMTQGFKDKLDKYVETNLQGYKELKGFQTLKDKNATHKVVIKGWYWRGAWSSPTKETVTIFYK